MSEHPAIVAVKAARVRIASNGMAKLLPPLDNVEDEVRALIEEVERLRADVESRKIERRNLLDAKGGRIAQLEREVGELRSRPVLDEAAEKRLRDEFGCLKWQFSGSFGTERIATDDELVAAVRRALEQP